MQYSAQLGLFCSHFYCVKYWLYISLFVFLIIFSSQSCASSDIWILVDTSEQRLSVMRGNKEQLAFNNIAIGRYGASSSRMEGDNQTPLGTFQINWIKHRHRYYRFFGVSFPDQRAADLALTEKRISQQTWLNITKAIESSKLPPQDTPLGGYIGIHGVGRGDDAIHSRFNWTNGCIALTNTQIDKLSSWVKIGTKIVIR